ncbi:hypothetical protein D3C77_360660 [compost metagenome]
MCYCSYIILLCAARRLNGKYDWEMDDAHSSGRSGWSCTGTAQSVHPYSISGYRQQSIAVCRSARCPGNCYDGAETAAWRLGSPYLCDRGGAVALA